MKSISATARKAIVVIAAMVSCVSAFAAADPFDFHCADIAYMQNKNVQKDMGITEAQRAKMNAHADANRAKIKAYEDAFKKKAEAASKAGKTIQPDQKLLMGYYGALKQQVLGELTAAQVKRLREITLQFSGLQGLLDAVVARRVGISDAVLAKLRTTFTTNFETVAKMKAAARDEILKPYRDKKPKDAAEAKKWGQEIETKAEAAQKRLMPRIRAIEQQAQKTMLGLLTPAQKASYKALQGKLFGPPAK